MSIGGGGSFSSDQTTLQKDTGTHQVRDCPIGDPEGVNLYCSRIGMHRHFDTCKICCV